MAFILPGNGVYPRVGKNYFLAENASITGGVKTGDNCSIWFNAVVEKGFKIAACAVVQENTIVESGYIYAGKPAKKIKRVSHGQKEIFKRTANNYIKYAEWFK